MWRASILTFVALISTAAFAAVELLPSSSPQRAVLGQEFAPVRVRVTDDAGKPAADAYARILLPEFLAATVVSATRCAKTIAPGCEVRADSDGIAEFHHLRGVVLGEHSFEIIANTHEPYTVLGRATLVLIVDPLPGSPRFEALSGSGQRVVAGSVMEPFAVRVRDAAGEPLAGVEVEFVHTRGTRVVFPGTSPRPAVLTDGRGVAVSPFVRADPGIGPGEATALLRWAPGYPMLRFEYTITDAAGRTDRALQDMWWTGFDETGWGVSIAQHGDRLFSVIYAYDAEGRPTWYVFGGEWRNRFVEFAGRGLVSRGTPFFAYDPIRLAIPQSHFDANLRFDDESAAVLQLTFAASTTRKRLLRQDFTSDTPAPVQGLGDMWWGGHLQNGWGIALMEQPGGLFSVWFTYDEAGAATWFAMPSGTWTSDSTFEGAIYQTSGPRWPDYDPSRLAVARVGSFAYRFHDREHATFSWTIGSRSGSTAITRQPF